MDTYAVKQASMQCTIVFTHQTVSQCRPHLPPAAVGRCCCTGSSSLQPLVNPWSGISGIETSLNPFVFPSARSIHLAPPHPPPSISCKHTHTHISLSLFFSFSLFLAKKTKARRFLFLAKKTKARGFLFLAKKTKARGLQKIKSRDREGREQFVKWSRTLG